MQIKASVTILEGFRKMMSDNGDRDLETQLIQQICRESKPNAKMKLGSAWHEALQNKLNVGNMHSWQDKTFLKVGDICFPQQAIEVIKSYQKAHETKLHEIPFEKVFSLGGDECTVSMRIDVMDASVIRDIKLRFSSMQDVHEYLDSCQWKFYCDAFETAYMEYDVFVAHRFSDDNLKNKSKDINGNWYLPKLRIQQEQPIKCTAYDGMHEELNQLVSEFIQWVRFRKLEGVLSGEKGKSADYAPPRAPKSEQEKKAMRQEFAIKNRKKAAVTPAVVVRNVQGGLF